MEKNELKEVGKIGEAYPSVKTWGVKTKKELGGCSKFYHRHQFNRGVHLAHLQDGKLVGCLKD